MGKKENPFTGQVSGAKQTIQKNINNSHALRQQMKKHVVCLACWGLLPVSWATWLITRMGLAHD
jgi:diacylglycerol kinase